MLDKKQEIIAKNPKIDKKIVENYDALLEKSTGFIKPQKGADYNITPPMGTKIQFERKVKST
ncbi:MAG: hypothetical protein U5R06_10635 [candidate division KSB1 bacterium]|nr:hypothetical protein [candidate division KSB1 bacterium]